MGLAFSMLIFSASVAIFGKMDLLELGQGLLSVMLLLAELGIVIMAMNGAGLSKSALGFIGLSVSMLIMYKAVQKFGEMDLMQLGQGLLTVMIILAELGIVVMALDGAKTLGAAAGILVLSVALYSLTGVVAILSKIDILNLLTGLAGLTGVLADVVGSIILLNYFGGSAGKILASAAAITVMSVGCMALAGAIKILSTIDMATMWSSVGALAVAVIALAAAGAILSTVGQGLVPVLLSIGGMFALIGAGVLLAGLGVASFAGGIAKLANLSEDAGMGLHNFIERLKTDLPALGRALGETIDEFAEGAKNAVPKAIKMLMDVFLTSFIQGLADGLPALIEAGIDLVTKFIKGLADSLEAHGTDLVDAVYKLADTLINIVGEMLGGAIGLIAKGVVSLGKGIIDGFKNILGINSPSKETEYLGEQVDAGFIKGLQNGVPALNIATDSVGSSILDSFANVNSGFTQIGEDAMASLSESLWGNTPDLQNVLSGSVGDLGIELPADVTSPTISPVLDLSNLNGADADISSLLNGSNGIGLDLDTSQFGDVSSVLQSNQNGIDLQSYSQFDDSNILAAIQRLEDRVAAVETEIQNTQITLDSGQLVGSLTRKMNDSLNQYNAYKRNGVY